MAITTIQLEKETKTALFQLKNQLEKSSGQSMTYNDLILYLLKTRASLSDRQNLESLRELRGLLGSDDAEAYRREKRRDFEREEHWR